MSWLNQWEMRWEGSRRRKKKSRTWFGDISIITHRYFCEHGVTLYPSLIACFFHQQVVYPCIFWWEIMTEISTISINMCTQVSLWPVDYSCMYICTSSSSSGSWSGQILMIMALQLCLSCDILMKLLLLKRGMVDFFRFLVWADIDDIWLSNSVCLVIF